MALQKQLVALPLTKGLDTKVDVKQEEPGYLRRAENVVYETLKLFRKRNGYDLLDPAVLDDVNLSGIKKLTKYGTELLALTATNLYSYSSARERFVKKGPLYSAATNSNVIYKNAASQIDTDISIVENFKIFTWEDSVSGVRYSVQDALDGSFLVSNGEVDINGERPVVSNIGNFIYIVYGNGADVRFRTFSVLEPQTLSTPVIVASDRDLTNGLIDAQNCGTKIMAAYNADNAGDNLSIFSINADNTFSSVLQVNSETASDALNLYCDSLARLILTYSDGIDFKYTIYPFNLNAALLAPTLIESVAGAAPTATLNLTTDIILTSDTAGPTRNGDTVTLEVNAAAANPTNTILVTFTGTIDAVTITITPNDGTNNGAVPVNLTTAELAELINTGLVTGKITTLTDASNLRADLSATGGDATNLANGGEGDGIVGTFAGGTTLPVVTASTIQTSATEYQVYYEVEQAGNSNNYVKQVQVNLTGTVGTKTVFARSVGLSSEVFEYQDIRYIPTVHESELQSTYFLFDENAALVTKWFNQTASGSITRGVLPTTAVMATGQYLFSNLFRNRLQAENGTFYSTDGVGAALIDFNPDFAYSSAELVRNLHICAGVLKLYDGATVTEHGFNLFPESLTNPSNSTLGGALTNGSRGYRAVYKWTDNTGKDHRSAPSLLPLEVTLSGGTSTQSSVIRVPTLRITDKENVVIELYRTEAAGTIYNLVTTANSPVLNNKNIDYVDITDTLSDADLISREVLYTTGDVLENLPAPAAFQVTAYNGNRLAVVGEQANRVYFSKLTSEEQPVEFTDAIYRDIDPIGGRVTAIINMASKLLVFETDATFFIAGEGPTNSGINDTFTLPETIATDIGCVSPDSLVLTPNGVLFKSRKGIWQITGNLAVQYTGNRVEAFNQNIITSAAIVGELNQVRFLLSETRALVYNYNLDLWATFENHGGISSIVIGNDYYYVRPDGAIYKENRSSFADVSSPIKMRLETGWLSLGEIQGYSRTYHAMILGSFKSTHKLLVKVAYDFIEAFTQEVTINPLDFVSNATYGSDPTYGDSSPYGGNGNLYQMRVDLERQKCQSLKLSIEDAQSVTGEGLNLSSITLRVGAKDGTNKLGSSNTFGTTTGGR